MYYATLEQVKRYVGLTTLTATQEARLMDFLPWATDLINTYKGRRYDARVETRQFDVPTSGASGFGVFDWSLQAARPIPPLRLDEDLLELSELLNGDGEEIESTQYVLEPANQSPKNRIRLRGTAAVYWVGGDDGNEQAIRVTGLWGYHDNYAKAWADSGDTVQDDPLAADALTLTAADADGQAKDLRSPRFQAGQLLRLEDELVYVLAVDADTNQLSVERGYNGSTAAEHAAGTEIEIWRVVGNIEQACVRLVKWRYTQKDTDNFDRVYVAGSGVVSVSSAIPSDVKMALGAPKARMW